MAVAVSHPRGSKAFGLWWHHLVPHIAGIEVMLQCLYLKDGPIKVLVGRFPCLYLCSFWLCMLSICLCGSSKDSLSYYRFLLKLANLNIFAYQTHNWYQESIQATGGSEGGTKWGLQRSSSAGWHGAVSWLRCLRAWVSGPPGCLQALRVFLKFIFSN